VARRASARLCVTVLVEVLALSIALRGFRGDGAVSQTSSLRLSPLLLSTPTADEEVKLHSCDDAEVEKDVAGCVSPPP
jgi:hypothetical protein